MAQSRPIPPQGRPKAEITRVTKGSPPDDAPSWRGAVIVVDDNPDDSLHLSRMIASCCPAGQRILLFDDGREFLRHMRHFSDVTFDITRDKEDLPLMVFLDLIMPGVDGPSILRDMRADPFWDDVPVTVSTQSHNDRLLTEMADLGANALLPKPFRRAEVFATLKHANHFSYNI